MSFVRTRAFSSLGALLPSIWTIQELQRVLDSLDSGDFDPGSSPAARRGAAIAIVGACGDLRAGSWQCRRIRALVERIGLGGDVAVANLMVNMYVRCGNLAEARALFEEIRVKDAVLWTAMASAHAHSGHYAAAFHLFRKMQLEGVPPDQVTLVTMVNACSSGGDFFLGEGRNLHERVVELGLISSNPFVGTALINMYGGSGKIDLARSIFEQMPRSNAIPWNAMIAAFAKNGHCREAIGLLREMLLEPVVPSGTTFVAVLSACTDVCEGIQIHDRVCESGHLGDVIVATALLNMYGKLGCPDRALEIFSAMRQRNMITWNAMVAALAHNERFEQAFGVFWAMQVEGIKPSEATFLAALAASSNLPAHGKLLHSLAVEAGFLGSILVSTALVEMYSRIGSVCEAAEIFERCSPKDVVLWNAMITAYAQAGHSKQALELFQGMQTDGVSPDSVSFLTILNACCSPEFLSRGREIHARMIKSGLTEDVFLGTALVNFYGKAGSVDDSRAVFDRMKQRSLVTWNAMISACVHDDHSSMLVFQRMQHEGIKPDKLTFVTILNATGTSLATGKTIHGYVLESGVPLDSMLETALLNMYSKAGGLDHSQWMFDRWQSRDDVSSWNTLVTVLARHGRGDEALSHFYRMQSEGARPNSSTFLSVLSGCSHSGLLWEGIQCFSSMVWDHRVEICEEHFGCVIDLLGRAGRLGEADEFIAKMPLDSNSVVWMSLLGASKIQGDAGRAKHAAVNAIAIDPRHDAAYVALSSTS
ncbi:pentatricopeptide repeat-containing protein At3g09040, mitochondrial [Selaginella moellendorffii]|uniref:pentatricopeptide repeat-containing protein At3g09040, mitochondrial n=1 Tax=Selaginella moellendorffii TaxID=88036 RepID=UPI000D1C3660|nr:pentatricopeptide repeat-containing protein At3g09040, mitochondrial [Selaginella moellendorffii]|eukprot:XP_024523182.1 pentatricopeptide repeat-containing protein At3g09040, mitochondrial [Selaginella moellendorffii]